MLKFNECIGAKYWFHVWVCCNVSSIQSPKNITSASEDFSSDKKRLCYNISIKQKAIIILSISREIKYAYNANPSIIIWFNWNRYNTRTHRISLIWYFSKIFFFLSNYNFLNSVRCVYLINHWANQLNFNWKLIRQCFCFQNKISISIVSHASLWIIRVFLFCCFDGSQLFQMSNQIDCHCQIYFERLHVPA